MKNVSTRFPPSPTGHFHIGSARTALFNYFFAKKSNASMYLRFEDTDRTRSKKEYEDDILQGLTWLGITYTLPDTYRQSERIDIYKAHLKRLLESGAAYEAEVATDAPDKKIIRFKNPKTKITFTDLVRGDVTFDTTDLQDFVIAKSLEEPLYHLAVVVDDHEMNVSHVIRGEDHISNTPRQILILEALGFERPIYAHIPLILAKDRSKLSKRHGAVSINEYRRMGILPEALVNYLALLGWTPSKDKEVLSFAEMVEAFDLKDMHKSGAVFDIEKLRWFNRQYMQAMTDTMFMKEALPRIERALSNRAGWSKDIGEKLVPIVRERISTWSDIEDLIGTGELDAFFGTPSVDPGKIPQKGSTSEVARKHLEFAKKALEIGLNGPTSPEDVKALLWDYADKEGRGAVLWPLRFSLSGRERSPDPFIIISIVGKEEALSRLSSAIKALS